MEQVGGGANFLQGLVDQVGEVVEEAGGLGSGGELTLERGDGHFEGGEGLAGAVVEFASDATTLFILQAHDAGGKFAQGVFDFLADGDLGFKLGQAGSQVAGAFVDFLFEFEVGFAEGLLGLFARGDVGGDADDAEGGAGIVADDLAEGFHPADGAVVGTDAVFEMIFGARILEDAGEGGVHDGVVLGKNHAADGGADFVGRAWRDIPEFMKFRGAENGAGAEVDFPGSGVRGAMGEAEAFFGMAQLVFGAQAFGDFQLHASAAAAIMIAHENDHAR